MSVLQASKAGVAGPKPAGAAAMPDLIFVSLENWDDVWRRNQFLCDGLARRFPSSKILFVGLSRDFSNLVRRGKFRELFAAARTEVPGLPNITITRPLKLLPNSIGFCRWFNEWMARRHVRGAAKAAGLENPVLWLNPHNAVSMAGKVGERAVIYDITDDWTELPQSRGAMRLTARQDARLCLVADAVIVCSDDLLKKKRALSGNVTLIPNGVHAAHYERVLDYSGPAPSNGATWRRPVLGYVGTVHPGRVDVQLVAEIARNPSTGSVVLVGPDHLLPADREMLEALGNVFLVGPVPYETVPDYMGAFDVCIVPHLVTPFTESLNPIKLWEYLAGGKPIVSTSVAGFRDFPEHVLLADNAEEFASAVGRALGQKRGRGEARRREARQHSWESRVDQVLRVIDACVRSAAKKGAPHVR